MNQVKRLSMIIKQATDLLQNHKDTAYSQKEIVERLKLVGCDISTSFFNQILKQQKGKLKNIQKVNEGLDIILERELGFIYDDEQKDYTFSNDPVFASRPIIPLDENGGITQTNKIDIYAAGRLSLDEKVKFFKNAKEEVVFFGIRLRQFANYFDGRKEQDFEIHIKELLHRGVNIRCYMLDPTWEQTAVYFRDRASKIERENQSLERMELIVKDLKMTMLHYESENYVGKMEVFTYRHFPQGNYLIVDGENEDARMQFASYLFGLSRSESPVQEIYKSEQPILFDKHWKSLTYLVEDAISLS